MITACRRFGRSQDQFGKCHTTSRRRSGGLTLSASCWRQMISGAAICFTDGGAPIRSVRPWRIASYGSRFQNAGFKNRRLIHRPIARSYRRSVGCIPWCAVAYSHQATREPLSTSNLLLDLWPNLTIVKHTLATPGGISVTKKIAVVAVLCAVVALVACRREEYRPLKLGGPVAEQPAR